ncbi:hypothetical protein C8J56DRAFT_893356 [Mycena floridula]|nr:hypothetical protein C8J56DRAFT_893356 [Mycena floridula]
MKDGPRPPMHVDGVSEGERANTDDGRKPEPDSPPSEEKAEEPVDLDETAKRRSKSRSRSRSSKDYKGKTRILQSPTPNAGDSSEDETSVPTSPFTLPIIPPLIAPIPSPFQHSRFLRSPTPTAQDISLLPYPSSPGTPLPSLETLSKNLILFRSNSAAGRMMAMHKLTGGTKSYEPSLSPSPPPLPVEKFQRTNTISGGEQRHAARAKVLITLVGRSTKDIDGEQGGGPEDVIMASPSPTPHKRRRRRSRRSSSTANANANANSGLSDSDFISTWHNTPLVPPTPLPPEFPPDFVFTRDRSVTPSHGFSPRGPTPDQRHQSPIPALPESSSEPDRPEIPRRRSVLIEEEEEERQPSSQKYSSNPPTPLLRSNPPTPLLRSNVILRALVHRSISALGYPRDTFPIMSAYLRYPADSYLSRTYVDNFAEREISWIADPVPQIRMPVDDDEDDLDEEDDDYEDERPHSARSSNGFSPQEGENPSPRDSSDSQQVLVESETSPETFIPTSPSSVGALSHTHIPYSPLNAEFTDLEISNDFERKRNMDSTSTWEKVKSTFTRSNSSSGRRSRSNSIATREMRDQTDSSVSRESGASLNSSKTDKADGSSMFATQQVRCSLHLAKYQNEKLFPFPGIKKLEEQRRAKGSLPVSPSTPEVNTLHEDDNPLSSNGFTSGPMEQAPYMMRSVPRQASDTVLNKFNISLPLSTGEHVDNVTSPTTPNSSSGRLPMTLPGVKQWLSNKKLFSGQTSPSPISPLPLEIRHMHQEFKKPSLSDSLRRKENEGEWDELGTANSDMWASAIENTPRKFFMCVSTLQVVNPNTVKDRFLFLFSDILVIAKLLMQQDDNKLTAMERKFNVKSVVQLKNLRFTGSSLAWNGAIAHFTPGLPLEDIDESYFRPRHFSWAVTGSPEIKNAIICGESRIKTRTTRNTGILELTEPHVYFTQHKEFSAFIHAITLSLFLLIISSCSVPMSSSLRDLLGLLLLSELKL